MKTMSRRILALLMSLVLIMGTQTSALAETMNQSSDESVVSEITIDESTDVDSSLTDGEILNEEENDITDSEIVDSQESDVSEEEVDEKDESDSEEIENEDELNEEDLSEEELSEEELSEEELSEEELSEEELSEEETKDAESEEDSMFPGAYTLKSLSAYEKSNIESLKSHAHEMDGLTPGVDYVENVIAVSADSEEEALEFAEAYNGKLLSYHSFVCCAYIELNADNQFEKASVSDAVSMSMNYDNNLPAAWPVYLYHMYDEDYEENNIEEGYEELVQSEYVDLSEVEGAPTGIASPETIYDDPYIDASNANYGVPYQWQHSMVGSEYAWKQGITGAGIKVAVLDEGVRPGHEDLRIGADSCFAVESVMYKEEEGGYHQVSKTQPDGTYGDHGTHVSGIIGATKNNNVGGCGIAPDVSIISVAVFSYNDTKIDKTHYQSSAFPDAILNGIELAIKEKVDIINMSLGGPRYDLYIDRAITKAKNAGIAVFVAAGNESTFSSAYPAGCKDAISVAAVDSNNATAGFSNRGNQVRYSGPGVNIYSTYSYNTEKYGYMGGTSQATPAITGVAALILSSGKVTGSGAQKVDNLLAIMDSGAISNKCCSKGTVNVAKALGISYSTTAPGVPVPNVKPGTFYVENMEIQLSNPAGYNDCDIYYTLDGSKITFKDGVISPNSIQYKSKPIKLEGKSTITVNAIAINRYTKLVSKQVSLKYILKPNVKTITVLSDTGLKTEEPVVVPGGSVVLKATVAPDYAANKKVNWIVAAGPSGADLSKVKVSNGTVKPAKDAILGQYTIRATAADNGGAYTDYKITVKTPDRQVSSIKLSATKGTVNVGATIYVPISDVVFADKSSAAKTGETISNFLGTPIYDSSLVTASINTEGKLVITGKKRGTAKITVVSHQNYGAIKKVVYTATVTQPVTGISLSTSSYEVVEGKTVTLGATVTPSDANNNKLVWSVDDSVKKIASVSGSGVFKATTAGTYNVYVASKENPTYKKTITVKVLSKSNAITKLAFDSKSVDVFRVTNDANCSTSKSVLLTITGSNTSYLSITSSNPDLVTVTVTSSAYTSSKKKVTVTATGNGTGKATITAISTDGGKVKATFTVNVVNPPSALTLALPEGRCEYLCYGKTLKLTPVFETKYGAIGSASKNLKWSSDKPWEASVDKSGNVKGNTYYCDIDHPVTITAETTDGSNLKASFKIYTLDCLVKLDNQNVTYGIYTDIIYSGGMSGLIQHNLGDYALMCPTVTTSNSHMRAFWMNGYLSFIADKPGSYTITLKSTDGSNKSCKISVRVR